MGQLGCPRGWLQQLQEAQQAEPGAKEARMSSLPSRKAGDGEPCPLLLHPSAAGRAPGSSCPPGSFGDERHCRNGRVWGADAVREDVGTAGFLSSSFGDGLVLPS